MYGYLYGKDIVVEEEICISPRDLGLLRGYSVFDATFISRGKPFLAKEHWEHFSMSARTLGLHIPVAFAQWKEIIERLVQKNGLETGSVRSVLTGGVSETGFAPEPGEETLYMLMNPWKPLPEEWYEKGVRVIIKEYARKFPQAKTASYIFPIVHRGEKERSGAAEMVYVSEGCVLEASMSNIAMVKNNTIATPKSDVLSGVTMEHILSLARGLSIPVVERDILLEELLSADEVFLTGSLKHILPVTHVDGQCVHDGRTGVITRRLMQEFQKAIKNQHE